MSKSITYYLTLFVIRMKGIKKAFRQDPIDYISIRKNDVHDPKSSYFQSLAPKTYTIGETKITEIKKELSSQKLLLYIHGGAFISGPSQHHWDSLEKIIQHTNHTVWMCTYPKAPEYKIHQIADNIDAVYHSALEHYAPENITIMGDSAGRTLAIGLTQRLVSQTHRLPSKLILLSPVLDSSFENQAIEAIDPKDPMLSKKGVVSAKKMYLNDGDTLATLVLSPIHGRFEGFPTTYLFIATHDITYPDQLLFCEKLERADVSHTVITGKEMPHIWPLLPVMKEAKQALQQIISIINT